MIFCTMEHPLKNCS